MRFLLVLSCLVWAFGSSAVVAQDAKPLKLNTTADHSKFEVLQKAFGSGPEVTRACLSCHTESAGQIHRTKHWRWEYLNPDTPVSSGGAA